MKLDGPCPHCKKDIQYVSDKMNFDKLEITKQVELTPQQKQNQILEKPEEKEVIKEVIKTQTPAHIPSFKCKDGNCGLMHKNPNYTKKIKGKCANCGQFTSNTDSECPFCNQKEYDELEEDELKDLGIPEPLDKDIHDHTE